jgi:preprotein translocase subunit SecE
VAVFGLLIYRAVAAAPRTSDFLIATEGEMKKVNWPARKEVTGSTLVVIWTVILLTILLFVADFLFSRLFLWIGILEKP